MERLDSYSTTTTVAALFLFVATVAAGCATGPGRRSIARQEQEQEQQQPVQKQETITKAQLVKLRQEHTSSSLSISYANSNPLWIVKGHEARLQDETGTWYLDTRNNVAHVGHCNARVVQAVQDQVAVLNTNTRYLHPHMTILAARLAALLPDPLQVVFFCNSGSEANDLALRLATVYAAGSTNTIVVNHAYHGHTMANLQVSPYKFAKGTEQQGLMVRGPGGTMVPGRHIWTVPVPHPKCKRTTIIHDDPVQHVQEACQYYQAQGQRVRAMIVEGGMSVAGVVLPPAGYLRACQAAVHAAGGLYIADEVQTGLGRLGKCMWAFQYHNDDDSDSSNPLVPDIVTMGKPLGNGMPLAALVTTRAVAQCFEQAGVEYFNTFAGNPVCAAAGLAVLDELQERNLQQHALQVGTYLRDNFQALMRTIPLIGDVRGSGFFLGVELVVTKNQSKLQEPATAETSYICSILKSKYHILTSIDGPADNVLVIKPPMVFSQTDADHFVKCFALAATVDLPAADLSKLQRTPT